MRRATSSGSAPSTPPMAMILRQWSLICWRLRRARRAHQTEPASDACQRLHPPSPSRPSEPITAGRMMNERLRLGERIGRTRRGRGRARGRGGSRGLIRADLDPDARAPVATRANSTGANIARTSAVTPAPRVPSLITRISIRIGTRTAESAFPPSRVGYEEAADHTPPRAFGRVSRPFKPPRVVDLSSRSPVVLPRGARPSSPEGRKISAFGGARAKSAEHVGHRACRLLGAGSIRAFPRGRVPSRRLAPATTRAMCSDRRPPRREPNINPPLRASMCSFRTLTVPSARTARASRC